MAVKCDHKFVLVGMTKSWKSCAGSKKIFKKEETFECVECLEHHDKNQFEHATAPPAWWMRDGQEN